MSSSSSAPARGSGLGARASGVGCRVSGVGRRASGVGRRARASGSGVGLGARCWGLKSLGVVGAGGCGACRRCRRVRVPPAPAPRRPRAAPCRPGAVLGRHRPVLVPSGCALASRPSPVALRPPSAAVARRAQCP
ncbi:hypothetical protein C6V05_13150 [Burkholderia multivorans]|nr:hypothetical protein C6V05_13150 [Burkholderia multivorans]